MVVWKNVGLSRSVGLCILWLTVAVVTSLAVPAAGTTIGFEELTQLTEEGPNGGYFNGNVDGNSNESGWLTGGAEFGNSFSSEFGGFWTGWAYSNVKDATTAGIGNQYAAITNSGADGSEMYAVGFGGDAMFINLPSDHVATSVQLTNTTYAALSMLHGDAFGKKFGGESGTDPDFFSVSIVGFDQVNATGIETGTQEVLLADYRFADHELDFVLDTWQTVDLTPLGNARSIGFQFSSSDIGDFGINTPTYLALDQLRFSAVPEPTGVGWGVIAFLLFRRSQ